MRSSYGDWLIAHGTEVIEDLTDTSRQALTAAVDTHLQGGQTLQVVVDAIAPYFGVDRALLIAVTETTRASDLADQVATKELTDAGFEMRVIWNTNRDQEVCSDCAIRDDKDSTEWPTPQRPPLHPGCRCWITHTIL